ncbi:MAG: acyl-[acyl-carrier-protein]--UDP-N-acetylglucosamine O-acyltransferase [Rickettsiales bacterium]|nr:acyl-[acyl-carrier-protein]--UDP-N-acetylglucosamine O-acyltransferase [Rickettsiales bacterium]|tara:strand:+ start:140 stop:928 length:789 start_codon:yes stop_codon:yes gene_type:complete
MAIHPTAIIADGATIADSAEIGPYCIVGENVTIGADTVLKSHVHIEGRTTIGAHCVIYPFASIGTPPQDLKYHGEPSTLEIGDHCTIREHVTMNPGTEGGGMATRVGSHCLFMMSSHVAHDCQVGNHVILANNATLAGHVTVGDGCVIGGLAAIHQFVRIGAYAMIGGMSGVEKDVIPFGSVMGERADLNGLNLVGMKRRQLARENIHALRNAYKTLFGDSAFTLEERIATTKAQFDTDEVREVIAFLEADSHRSFSTPKAS